MKIDIGDYDDSKNMHLHYKHTIHPTNITKLHSRKHIRSQVKIEVPSAEYLIDMWDWGRYWYRTAP